jgi:hypothetical protein
MGGDPSAAGHFTGGFLPWVRAGTCPGGPAQNGSGSRLPVGNSRVEWAVEELGPAIKETARNLLVGKRVDFPGALLEKPWQGGPPTSTSGSPLAMERPRRTFTGSTLSMGAAVTSVSG